MGLGVASQVVPLGLGLVPPLATLQPPPGPYLVPTVGTVTTPDPGPLPAECCFVFKVWGPVSGGATWSTIAAQFEASGQYSWLLQRNDTTSYRIVRYPTGATTGSIDDRLAAQAPTGADETLAAAIRQNDGAGATKGASWRLDAVGWTRLVDNDSLGATAAWFDSPAPVRIGGYAAGGGLFDGRIYWCELRTGLDPAAGTVVWRFDADEYPGSGATWTDPRGRQWTVTDPAAIVEP